MAHNMGQTNGTSSTDESKEMMAIWPDIVRDLTEDNNIDIPEANTWLKKVLQYNVPNGKKNRAIFLVDAFRLLAPRDRLTEENLRLARILGWCIELLQTFFIIEDDIIDHATTRRGKLCWYLHNNLGKAAINDGILVEQTIYQLLFKYFNTKPYYVDLLDIFHDMSLKAIIGEALDLSSNRIGKRPKFNLFTMHYYNKICKYKTTCHSIVMPVTLAMYLGGTFNPETIQKINPIFLEMGRLFQIQDDYLDCYGDSKVTGKVTGTDIKEGKCTWLAVVALQRATPSQRKVFEDYYGYDDEEKVARIKELYDDLGLPTTYTIYEEESYNLMNTHIQQISHGLPHELFSKISLKVYRRNA